MRYLSLFSGIEACTVAWQALGWECVAVAEIEPFPCAVLAHHYPSVPNLGDVTKITEEDIKNLGQIDLVVFGSPCQNLSVAGNRKGLQGESSGLFYEAIRLIEYARKHCGARFALWENVPGAFSSNKGDDFREVVRGLSVNRDINTPENGWGNTGVALGENGLVEWRVLDAQYFGLAQRRKRVFAIVDFGNWQDRPPILLEPKSLCGNTPPNRETGKSIARNTEVSTVREGSFGTFVDSETAGTTKASGGVLGGGSESLVVVHGSQDPITNYTTANCLGRNNGLENVIAYSIIADATPKIGTEICGTLRSQGGGGIVPPSVVYGFDTKQQTPKIEKELTQALVATGYKEPIGVVSIAGNIIGRSPQNGGNGNGFDEEVCYTLTTADRHAVAFQKNTRDEVRLMGGDGQIAGALAANIGMKQQNYICESKAFSFDSLGSNSMKSANPNSGCREVELSKTLDTTVLCPSKNQGGIAIVEKPTSSIRRLTPTECERLQGFPDDYTKIAYRNKPIDECPNSPRYKALGNSMAVPVMCWIGKQIMRAVA